MRREKGIIHVLRATIEQLKAIHPMVDRASASFNIDTSGDFRYSGALFGAEDDKFCVVNSSFVLNTPADLVKDLTNRFNEEILKGDNNGTRA